MTTDERYALLRARLERAQEHFNILNSGIIAFLSTNLYEINTNGLE